MNTMFPLVFVLLACFVAFVIGGGLAILAVILALHERRHPAPEDYSRGGADIRWAPASFRNVYRFPRGEQ
jgi:hypothetical protein